MPKRPRQKRSSRRPFPTPRRRVPATRKPVRQAGTFGPWLRGLFSGFSLGTLKRLVNILPSPPTEDQRELAAHDGAEPEPAETREGLLTKLRRQVAPVIRRMRPHLLKRLYPVLIVVALGLVAATSFGILKPLLQGNAEPPPSLPTPKAKATPLPSITLAPQRAHPGSQIIQVDIVLPAGYELNPGAPSTIGVTAYGAIQLASGLETAVFTQPRLPLQVPVTVAKGKSQVDVDLSLYYCLKGHTGKDAVCCEDHERLLVPVTGDGAYGGVTVTRAVSRP